MPEAPYNSIISQLKSSIEPFDNFFMVPGKIHNLPELPGIYCFWWQNKTDSDKSLIASLNRTVFIKGKKLTSKEMELAPEHLIHKVCWDWNIQDKDICLYVGKTSSIAKRVKMHLGLSHTKNSDSWYLTSGLAAYKTKKAEKYKNGFLLKWDTACQFRAGIEHLLRDNTKNLLFTEVLRNNIGFSYFTKFDSDSHRAMTERFYVEDFAIGVFRPWFNVDSER